MELDVVFVDEVVLVVDVLVEDVVEVVEVVEDVDVLDELEEVDVVDVVDVAVQLHFFLAFADLREVEVVLELVDEVDVVDEDDEVVLFVVVEVLEVQQTKFLLRNGNRVLSQQLMSREWQKWGRSVLVKFPSPNGRGVGAQVVVHNLP